MGGFILAILGEGGGERGRSLVITSRRGVGGVKLGGPKDHPRGKI